MPSGHEAFTCIECGSNISRVMDSRANEVGIRRRRECENGHRFTTQEIHLDEWQTQIEEIANMILKTMVEAGQKVRDTYRNRNRG